MPHIAQQLQLPRVSRTSSHSLLAPSWRPVSTHVCATRAIQRTMKPRSMDSIVKALLGQASSAYAYRTCELEIGQVAILIDRIMQAGEILREIIESFEETRKSLT